MGQASRDRVGLGSLTTELLANPQASLPTNPPAIMHAQQALSKYSWI